MDYENLITYCNNNIITYNSIYSSINNYNKVQYNNDINKSKTLNDLFSNASGDFTLANKKNLLLLHLCTFETPNFLSFLFYSLNIIKN